MTGVLPFDNQSMWLFPSTLTASRASDTFQPHTRLRHLQVLNSYFGYLERAITRVPKLLQANGLAMP